MQALIEFIEVRSIEDTGDFPKVEVCARVVLPRGEIKSIDKARIAEGVRAACVCAVILDRRLPASAGGSAAARKHGGNDTPALDGAPPPGVCAAKGGEA